MNKNILNEDQVKLLDLVKTFSADFYLVGGTAIALHLGHRRSIDFDLFSDKAFDPMIIRNKIILSKPIGYTFQELMKKTNSIYKSEFNEKLFRTQLAYFEDIDYSEAIEYIEGFEKNDNEIKKYLEKVSLS